MPYFRRYTKLRFNAKLNIFTSSKFSSLHMEGFMSTPNCCFKKFTTDLQVRLLVAQ